MTTAGVVSGDHIMAPVAAKKPPGYPLSDSHILVDFLPHIPCELSAVLDGLEIGPA